MSLNNQRYEGTNISNGEGEVRSVGCRKIKNDDGREAVLNAEQFQISSSHSENVLPTQNHIEPWRRHEGKSVPTWIPPPLTPEGDQIYGHMLNNDRNRHTETRICIIQKPITRPLILYRQQQQNKSNNNNNKQIKEATINVVAQIVAYEKPQYVQCWSISDNRQHEWVFLPTIITN